MILSFGFIKTLAFTARFSSPGRATDRMCESLSVYPDTNFELVTFN